MLKEQIEIKTYQSLRPAGSFWQSDIVFARFVKLYDFGLSISKSSCTIKSTVLDAATGLGYGAKLLNLFFDNVYGIDISDEAVNYAKVNYEGPRFKKGDVLNIPFDDSSFNAVFSIETLEHLDKKDHKTYLNELIRVTKTEGFIFISTPNKPVYSSLHMVKDHYGELDFFELKSLIENNVTAEIKYYQFGTSVGKSLNKLKSIEKFSTLIRKIYGRIMGIPFPRNINFRKAMNFWDITPLKNGNLSLGYLNIAVLNKLTK